MTRDRAQRKAPKCESSDKRVVISAYLPRKEFNSVLFALLKVEPYFLSEKETLKPRQVVIILKKLTRFAR